MKKPNDEILLQVDSSYGDLILRKNLRMRIIETLVFIVGLFVSANILNTQSAAFKVSAFAIAAAVIGLAPFVYKAVLRPRYTLTKTHLIVSISGKETAYPLTEVEPVIEGRHYYKLRGKRESLMVSRDFLVQLNERIHLFQRKGKRR